MSCLLKIYDQLKVVEDRVEFEIKCLNLRRRILEIIDDLPEVSEIMRNIDEKAARSAGLVDTMSFSSLLVYDIYFWLYMIAAGMEIKRRFSKILPCFWNCIA